jgi:hypothetical protein
MFGILGLALTAGATFFGYTQSRAFVRGRLRFVDAVQRSGVPLLAGIAAFAVAAPVVGLLPLVGGGTAILFGAGVGLGVAHGRGDIRYRIGSGR